jgi:hypothetical protein
MRRTQTLGRIVRIVTPALIAGFIALLFSGCELLTGPDESPVVDGVSVWPSVSTVAKGGTLDFTATVYGTGNVAQTVIWSLDSTSVPMSGTKIEEIALGGGGGGQDCLPLPMLKQQQT